MAAKAQGLSTDPIMAEIGGSKGYTEQELEEVRSPILQNRPDPNRQQSYQNPYDIRSVAPSTVQAVSSINHLSRYQSRDNISYYEVEGPPIRHLEQDMGYGYGYGMPNQSSDTIFPTARPSGTADLRRQQTTDSTTMYAQDTRQTPDYANFPVPSPSVGVAK